MFFSLVFGGKILEILLKTSHHCGRIRIIHNTSWYGNYFFYTRIYGLPFPWNVFVHKFIKVSNIWCIFMKYSKYSALTLYELLF